MLAGCAARARRRHPSARRSQRMTTRASARATRARRGETECRASTPTFGGGIGRRRTSRRARGGTRRAARQRIFPRRHGIRAGASTRGWRTTAQPRTSTPWSGRIFRKAPAPSSPGPRTRRGRAAKTTTWTPRRTKATSTRAMTLTKTTSLPRRATRSVPNSAPRLRTTPAPADLGGDDPTQTQMPLAGTTLAATTSSRDRGR